jgi:hypothetical protein
MKTVPFLLILSGERERPSIMVFRPPLIKAVMLVTAIADLAHIEAAPRKVRRKTSLAKTPLKVFGARV